MPIEPQDDRELLHELEREYRRIKNLQREAKTTSDEVLRMRQLDDLNDQIKMVTERLAKQHKKK